MLNVREVVCTPETAVDGSNYNVTFLAFPTFPYESNFIVNDGNPPIEQFACDTSLITDAESISCSISDITDPTHVLPGRSIRF